MKLPWDATEPMKGGKYVRVRSNQLYHTRKWTRLAKAFKQSHPLCEECAKNGIIRAAEVIDHIVPFPICKDYFFDVKNLQALCRKCNIAKGNRDKKVIEEWKRNNPKPL